MDVVKVNILANSFCNFLHFLLSFLAHLPINIMSSMFGICANTFSCQATAHSFLGGKSPDFPVPGKHIPIGGFCKSRNIKVS